MNNIPSHDIKVATIKRRNQSNFHILSHSVHMYICMYVYQIKYSIMLILFTCICTIYAAMNHSTIITSMTFIELRFIVINHSEFRLNLVCHLANPREYKQKTS